MPLHSVAVLASCSVLVSHVSFIKSLSEFDRVLFFPGEYKTLSVFSLT